MIFLRKRIRTENKYTHTPRQTHKYTQRKKMMDHVTTQFCDAIQNKLGRVKNAASIFIDDSGIIPESKREELEDMLTTSLVGINELKLLYRGTKDGFEYQSIP